MRRRRSSVESLAAAGSFDPALADAAAPGPSEGASFDAGGSAAFFEFGLLPAG
jgi:hypothetical protein